MLLFYGAKLVYINSNQHVKLMIMILIPTHSITRKGEGDKF